MAKLTLLAKEEYLCQVMDFVEASLVKEGCWGKSGIQIQMAVEEIYINIARYAYPLGEEGELTICLEVGGEPFQAVITFADTGIPFNPLEHQDPDTALPAEERPEGGLGIFMVKKLMDQVEYVWQENKNILTIYKRISRDHSTGR